MGKSRDDSAWLDTAIPEGFTPRPARRLSLLAKVGLAALILAVALPCAYGAVLWCLLVLPPIATAVDAQANSVPFEPGRWETEDGAYWVELRADGTGSVRLPGDARPGACHQDLVEGGVTYSFGPDDRDSYGNLYVGLNTPDDPKCAIRPFLSGGGWGDGGYNWDLLNYSKGDPDTVDLVLHRVD